ncbi:hypothetical protein COOONC_01128 [Cooperia oncophora]
MALEAEKDKSAIVPSVDAKESEISKLKHEMGERMEDIGRLISHPAAKRDELRRHATATQHQPNSCSSRVRPPFGQELDVPINHSRCPKALQPGSIRAKDREVLFQRVFGPDMSKTRGFNVVEELILSCPHVYNVSIIAYGQTGTG